MLFNALLRFKGSPEGLFLQGELRPVVGGCLTVSWCTVQGFRGSGQEASCVTAARICRFHDVCCFKCGPLMDDSHSRRMFRLPACLNHRHSWKMSLTIRAKVWHDIIQNYAFKSSACTLISHFLISETMAKIGARSLWLDMDSWPKDVGVSWLALAWMAPFLGA